MTRKQLLQKIKQEQKARAKEIRELKSTRKQDKRNGRQLYAIESDIVWEKYEFRHHHIAYCEMRGRTRDQIECPREDNLPVQREIDRIKEEWMEQLDEDVHTDAA